MYTPSNKIGSMRNMANALRSQQYDPRRQKSALSGLAHVLRQYGANKGDARAGQLESDNDALKAQEMAQLAQAMQGNPGMGESPEFGHPDVASMDTQYKMSQALAEQKRQNTPKPQFTLGNTRYLGDGSVLATAPAEMTPNKAFNPDGSANPEFQAYQADLKTKGKSVTNVNLGKPQAKYLEARATGQASTFNDLEKAADGAIQANTAIDRFMASSATGTEGGAQPLISGVQNFLASFGFDADALTDVSVMNQAIGQILGAKMAELGARGLTDEDMKILKQSLPQVATSHEARIAVSEILKEANSFTVDKYYRQAGKESDMYPEHEFLRPNWYDQNKPLGVLLDKYAPE